MPFAVEGLSKAFYSNIVLDNVDLAVADGEIHALLGANGAGKSTLIKCISGAQAPDAGAIVLGADRHNRLTPKQAQREGVCVVHQDPTLAQSLNVTDNVFLGTEIRIGPFVRHRRQRAQVRRWLDLLDVRATPGATLKDLSSAELQIVEIIRALRQTPKMLILDEPTASLTTEEAEQLGNYLRQLKGQRIPILYVTHRLGEVFSLSDRVSVLRDGRIVHSGRTADTNEEALVEAILGRKIENRGAVTRPPAREDRPLLRVRGLCGAAIGPVDLDVKAGEILGIYGLTGSGRTELLEALFGADSSLAGTVAIDGRQISLRSPRAAVASGIVLVPSDRQRKSVLRTMAAIDNMLIPRLGAIAWNGVRDKSHERRRFDDVARRLDLQPPTPEESAQRFSGGNQQKLVIGRWLQPGDKFRLLMMDEPTQGVDVGARSGLYAALRNFVADGTASALVTSSEPSELIQLAHRVVVLVDGRIRAEFTGDDITEANLLKAAQRS
ncbi:MAG: sugar ABC transporter ATP-binding protein [Parvibaculaceae bacterium]